MHDYVVHEAVYLNCEIHVSWARVLSPGAGPSLQNSENVLNLLYCQIYMRKSICMIIIFMKLWRDLFIGTFIFALMTLTLEFDLLLKNFNIGHITWIVSDRAFIFSFEDFLWQDLCIGTFIFDLMTLTLEFDLLLKTFTFEIFFKW
jgi:hypothetical protein